MSETPDETTQEQDGPEPDETLAPVAPDAEDEEVEAGESEEVEGAEGEGGEPEPEQPQALSQKQLEQAFGKLERETERHSKRIHEIVGDDAEMLVACPLCDPLIPGFVMPTPATPERFPAVRQFIGDAPQRELRKAPDAHRCEVCDGWGVLDTDSRVQGQGEVTCKACGAYGWDGPRRQEALSPPPPLAPVAAGNGEGQPVPQGPEPPEAAKLRALGYTLIQPVGA